MLGRAILPEINTWSYTLKREGVNLNFYGGTRGVCGSAEDNLIAVGPNAYREAGVYH